MNMNDFIKVLQEDNVSYSIDGDKIVVAENLDLSDTSITSLPDNLSVGGWLDLRGTSITSLPNNLCVGGWFSLRNTEITSLPDNLKVGRFIHLDPEEITNIAYRKLLRDGDYTVFAAWLNGECCVVDNSMIYTLEEFYGETADVARAARECVAELKQLRESAMNIERPTMKLSNLNKLLKLSAELSDMKCYHKMLMENRDLSIDIDSMTIRRDTSKLARDGLIEVLKTRIGDIKEELICLGVDDDSSGD